MADHSFTPTQPRQPKSSGEHGGGVDVTLRNCVLLAHWTDSLEVIPALYDHVVALNPNVHLLLCSQAN